MKKYPYIFTVDSHRFTCSLKFRSYFSIWHSSLRRAPTIKTYLACGMSDCRHYILLVLFVCNSTMQLMYRVLKEAGWFWGFCLVFFKCTYIKHHVEPSVSPVPLRCEKPSRDRLRRSYQWNCCVQLVAVEEKYSNADNSSVMLSVLNAAVPNRAGKKGRSSHFKKPAKVQYRIPVACLATQQIQLHVAGSIPIFATASIYYSNIAEKRSNSSCTLNKWGDSSEHNMVLADTAKQRQPQMSASLHGILQNSPKPEGQREPTAVHVFWPSRLADSTGMAQAVKYASHSDQETKHMNQILLFHIVAHL